MQMAKSVSSASVQDTVVAINLTCPDGMGTEEYSQHATALLQLLQIAYEVQLADMEELELRVESTHSLEQVPCHNSPVQAVARI